MIDGWLSLFLPLVNRAGEAIMLFGIVLAVAAGRAAALRLILYRCAFVLTLATLPLLLVTHTEYSLVALESGPSSRAADIAIRGLASPAHLAGAAEPGNADWVSPGGLAGALLFFWLFGALAVMAKFAGSLLSLRRAFSRARPAPPVVQHALAELRRRFGLRGNVGLAYSDRVALPCTFGWRAPKILLPEKLVCSADMLKSVLAHEICHIRHRDAMWLAIGHLACALNWFNPLAWMCLRRHRRDIEMVCDAAVIERQVAVHHYAGALLRTAQSLTGGPVAGLAMGEEGLAHRVRILLDRAGPSQPLARGTLNAAYGAMMSGFVLLATTDIIAARPEAVPTLPANAASRPLLVPGPAARPADLPVAEANARAAPRRIEGPGRSRRQPSAPAPVAVVPGPDQRPMSDIALAAAAPADVGVRLESIDLGCGQAPCAAALAAALAVNPAPLAGGPSIAADAPVRERVTCRTYPTASRARVSRVCMTQGDWERAGTNTRRRLSYEWRLL